MDVAARSRKVCPSKGGICGAGEATVFQGRNLRAARLGPNSLHGVDHVLLRLMKRTESITRRLRNFFTGSHIWQFFGVSQVAVPKALVHLVSSECVSAAYAA